MEMLHLIRAIDYTRYSPRIYVLADTDEHSERKVLEFERSIKSNDNTFCFLRIPRSREVRQSYLTSVFTTVRAMASAIPLIMRERPNLLLCNGPGTCIPICASFFMLKVRDDQIFAFVCDHSICCNYLSRCSLYSRDYWCLWRVFVASSRLVSAVASYTTLTSRMS